MASGFHGVLSYRKQKLLNGLKPGMRTLDLYFSQIIMATEEERMVGASQLALVVKNPPANAGDMRNTGSIPGKIPWRRKWQPTPVFLPGESYGQRSLAGYSA